MNLELYIGIPLALSTGLLIGFILPLFNIHALKFHQGYNLYNTGFSMGVLSMVLTGVITSFTPITRQSEVSNLYHYELFYATIIISLLFIVFAFVINPKVYLKYPKLMKRTGRLISDFAENGKDVAMLNIGVMGLFSIAMVLIFSVKINGPVMGAILTIMGFAAFGKHPKNSFPVVLGAALAIWLTPIDFTLGPILALFFVTGLAPLAGRFGFIAGVTGGFLHLLITPLALSFQGGFDLYNNGFAAGFVAAILSSLFIAIKPDEPEKEM
jgi:MFS family permease